MFVKWIREGWMKLTLVQNEGENKNRSIEKDGVTEIESGNFSEGTKVREGVVPPAHLGARGGKRID